MATHVVVLQVNRMGDLLLSLPLLERLKQMAGGRHVTLVCLDEFAAIVAANPAIDCLCPIASHELADPAALVRAHAELQRDFALAVNVSADVRAAALMGQLRAAEKKGRLAAQRDELRVAGDWGKYFFAYLGARPDNLFHLSDILTGMAGVPLALPVPRPPAPAGGTPARWRVALQMGASHPQRAWPVESFRRMAELLAAACPIDLVLVGAPAEASLGEAFMNGNRARVDNRIGSTTLAELGGLLATCHLLVSNDTGPLHIAAAAGVPVLGLYFSHAYFAETAPYGAGHMVLQAELPCSPCDESFACPTVACRRLITPDAVAAVAAAMLRGEREATFACDGLSVYATTRSPGGWQEYAPRQRVLSEHYGRGLLGQRLWLPALTERADLAAWRQNLAQCDPDTALPVLWRQAGRGFADLARLLAAGGKLARGLAREAQTASGDNPALKPLIDGLNRIERHIETAPDLPESWRKFFSLAMMDLPFAAMPELALAMAGVYDRLQRMAEQARPDAGEIEPLLDPTVLAEAARPADAVERVSRFKRLPAHYRQAQVEQALLDQAPPVVADILVVVRDQPAYVRACLESLARHSPACPVYVWDNGSQPETADFLRGLAAGGRIQLERSDANLGFIVPNNRLAARGRSPYLILLNSDTEVLAGWERALVAMLQSDPQLALTGYLGGLLDEAAEPVSMALGRAIDYVAGYCLCLARSTFKQYGLFDERLRMAYFEDSDLSIRLREAGRMLHALHLDLVRHFENKTVTAIVADEAARADFAASFAANRQHMRATWADYLKSRRVLAR